MSGCTAHIPLYEAKSRIILRSSSCRVTISPDNRKVFIGFSFASCLPVPNDGDAVDVESSESDSYTIVSWLRVSKYLEMSAPSPSRSCSGSVFVVADLASEAESIPLCLQVLPLHPFPIVFCSFFLTLVQSDSRAH